MNINRKVKLIVSILAVSIVTVLTTGCLGVFQQVTLSDSGRYAMSVKMSMSKEMIRQMDAMGGNSEDTDEIFDLEDAPFDPESIPGLADVSIEQVDDETDVGIRFEGILELVPDGTTPQDAPFIPFEDGNTVVIGLPPMFEDNDAPSDPQEDQMEALFFASSKYQLILDKYLYYTATSAKVSVGETDYPASLVELPGSWLIEFPMSIWMTAKEDCVLTVTL